jgi:hypothetical protein
MVTKASEAEHPTESFWRLSTDMTLMLSQQPKLATTSTSCSWAGSTFALVNEKENHKTTRLHLYQQA